MSNTSTFKVLGRDTARKDGIAKVTGREKFASDLSLRNMLHARVLKSPHAHAEVIKIDTSGAEKLGAAVLTSDEVPDVMFCPRLVSTPDSTFKDWRILTKHPRYVGEAIAAVAAETEEDAQKALEAIEVEYQTFPAYFDPHSSHEQGATQIHDHIILEDKVIKPEKNVACELHIKEGDVDEALKGCDVVLERTYTTNRRYQTQLETKSVVVRPEIDGGVTVWSTTQTLHNSRLLLHEIFGLPMGKIRIMKVPLGGSFGSSIQVNTVVPIAVALALKTKRPVKLTYTREEDAHDHVSYGMVFNIKLGVKKDGKLVAGHLDAYMDIGAHQIQAYPLLGCMVGWWVSLYKLEAKTYDGYAIYTNKTPACAFRGYGNPQVSWMVETMMDELAEKIGMDPVDFRLKNYIGQGDLFWGQGPSVKSLIHSCGVEEILTKGAELSGWYNRPKAEGQTGRYRRGIGMGRGFHTSSAGAPVPSKVIDFSGAIIKLNEDGTVDYITALMDHGGGTEDAHAKIIAETLCMPLDNVNLIRADTSTTVYDVCTHASRGIYSGGGAAMKVAKQLKEKISQFAARMLDAEASALSFRCDDERKQGVVYAEGIENREVTFKEIAYNARHKNWGTAAVVDSYRQPSCPPHFTGYFLEVEVDTWTGKVRLIKVIAGADVGTVVNPKLALGQIHGGFAQGWSMATLEDMDYDPDTGDLTNKGMITDYKIPYTSDMPDLDDFVVFFADTYESTGPFGAKGLGEGALNPVAGAVANAIQNALGIRFYRLPLTKERILEAIMEKEGQ
ncbi:xanthine dehydrogenase family protein molybdopterin-binding subunit [Candidatus Bathyarchaeota archaeon]|nr:MAG: xanthine dehydrogenase family protein molybdopterin-binding subunit [Candidatus Bathyarchaeota archaeon]